MESKTATAVGAGIVSVITPLVFPAIPLPLGVVLYGVAGSLFLYAARDKLREILPQGWRSKQEGQIITGEGREWLGASQYDPVELTEYLAKRLIAYPNAPQNASYRSYHCFICNS